MFEMSKEEFEVSHAALYFYRPPSMGAHELAIGIYETLCTLGVANGPVDSRTGYAPMTCPTKVEVSLLKDRGDMVILAAALEQGYEREAYPAQMSKFIPTLIKRVRNV